MHISCSSDHYSCLGLLIYLFAAVVKHNLHKLFLNIQHSGVQTFFKGG